MSNTKFALRTIALALAGSVLVFLGVGMLLADRWQVTTTRTIPAQPAVLAPFVGNLSSWPTWSAYDFVLGNPTEKRFEGEPGQSGQLGTWSGPKGRAKMTLGSVGEQRVEYQIGFEYGESGGTFGGKFTGDITWREVDGQTEITWTENGQLENLLQRWSNWFGALQDKVQQVQRASLAGLEEHVRRGGKAKPAAKAAANK